MTLTEVPYLLNSKKIALALISTRAMGNVQTTSIIKQVAMPLQQTELSPQTATDSLQEREDIEALTNM